MDPVNNDKEKSSASSSEAASSSSEASGSSTRPARALSMVTPAPQSGGDRRCTLIKSASGAHFQPTRNLRSLNVSSSEPSSSESESSRLEGKRKKTIPIIKEQSVIGFIKPITIVNEELIKDPRVERLNALISCYNDYIKNGKFQSTKAIITLQKIDFLARQLSLEPSTITVNGWTKRSSYNFIRKWYATSNIASQFQRYNGLDGKQYTPALSTLAQYYCCELLARKVRNPKFKEYKGLSDKIQAALSMAIRTETAFLERASSVSIESLETNYYYSLQELKFCVLSELSLNNSDLIEDKNKRRQLNDLLSVVDAKLFPLMKKSTALSKKFAMHRYVNEKYLSDFIENAVADEGNVRQDLAVEVGRERAEVGHVDDAITDGGRACVALWVRAGHDQQQCKRCYS